MGTMASQITSLSIVYSTVYSSADQRKHQSSASLAVVQEIHLWLLNSPHKLFLSIMITLWNRESWITGWCPSQMASDAGLWCPFVASKSKLLNNQSRDWWFETPCFSCDVILRTASHYDYSYITRELWRLRSLWRRFYENSTKTKFSLHESIFRDNEDHSGSFLHKVCHSYASLHIMEDVSATQVRNYILQISAECNHLPSS